MKDGANVAVGVPDLEWSRTWREEVVAVGANTVPSELKDWFLACEGEAVVESGDFEGENRADFGRLGASGPGEGEAFLTKGLLRTDMVCGFMKASSQGGIQVIDLRFEV
jgi:hypothetical protein